jgi:hypothetical protein
MEEKGEPAIAHHAFPEMIDRLRLGQIHRLALTERFGFVAEWHRC